MTGLKTLEPYRQPVLARDFVRYVGEPLAVVFAENAYLAEDAADLVEVSIEQLSITLLATEQPSVYEHEQGKLTTEASVLQKSYGDVDAAFRNAHVIVSLELSIGRHSGVPIETRGAIARYDEANDILEMHGAAKVPHWNRDTLVQMLGRKRESVQLYEGHVGGGFGIRGEIYPEDVLVCAAALKFRKPIKWIEDRREHLIAANHSREQHHKVRAAIDARGQILGIDDEFFHNNGAYMRTHAATVPDLAAAMLPGPYRVPAYRAVGHIRLTNKTPCGTYRAPGRYESSFVRERLLDAIAAKVGIDKVEIRRRNLIAKARCLMRSGLETLGTKIVYDSGDYAALLDKALALADWKGLQRQLVERRASGEKVGAGRRDVRGEERARAIRYRRNRDEIPTVRSKLSPALRRSGKGLRRSIAQICADVLGTNYSDIKVIHGQTDRIDKGMGAFASRVTVMCGEATRLAATKLRGEVLELAAELMQTKAELLTISDGRIIRTDSFFWSIDAAHRTRRANACSHAEATFESSHMVYPYGVHVATVRVDGDTGGVTIERYVDRLRHRQGGESATGGRPDRRRPGAGDSAALCSKNFIYDENGEPLSVTFADYLMPTAREIPALSILVTEDAPSPLNRSGLKGAGEGGANPVGAVDRLRYRRRAAASRRGDAAAGHAAALEGVDDADLSR